MIEHTKSLLVLLVVFVFFLTLSYFVSLSEVHLNHRIGNFVTFDYDEVTSSPTQFETVEEAWPEGSDLSLISYITDPPFLITPPSLDLESLKTVIVVTSAPHSFERRAAVRRTWAAKKFTRDQETEVVFLLGHDGLHQKSVILESEKHRDILQGNFQDSYMNLTLKTVYLLKFFSDASDEVGFDPGLHVLKTDDDCYVNVGYLNHLAREVARLKVISGAVLGRKVGHLPVIRPPEDPAGLHDKWEVPYWMYKPRHYPSAVSGSGYLFNAKFAECMYRESLKIPMLPLEDIFITGLVSRQCDMSLKHSELFLYMGADNICLADRHAIVVHRVDLDQAHLYFHPDLQDPLKPLCSNIRR